MRTHGTCNCGRVITCQQVIQAARMTARRSGEFWCPICLVVWREYKDHPDNAPTLETSMTRALGCGQGPCARSVAISRDMLLGPMENRNLLPFYHTPGSLYVICLTDITLPTGDAHREEDIGTYSVENRLTIVRPAQQQQPLVTLLPDETRCTCYKCQRLAFA